MQQMRRMFVLPCLLLSIIGIAGSSSFAQQSSTVPSTIDGSKDPALIPDTRSPPERHVLALSDWEFHQLYEVS